MRVQPNILNKYYLYRHIREDKNIPFYIGIGKKRSREIGGIRTEYYRAFITTRNCIWKSIVNRTSYFIDIVFETDDYELILQKEIEFIRLYGRIDQGDGTLSNQTDGGEGITNLSLKSRDKISSALKGRVKSIEHRQNLSKAISGVKRSPRKPETKEKIRQRRLESNHMNGKCGYLHHNAIPIVQLDLNGNVIREWSCGTEAARELCLDFSALNAALNRFKKGQKNRSQGYKWEYKC